jgi:hypothetical protein
LGNPGSRRYQSRRRVIRDALSDAFLAGQEDFGFQALTLASIVGAVLTGALLRRID